MSVKNSSDTLGNPIRDLPVCCTVPQPTAPLRQRVNSEQTFQDNISVLFQGSRNPRFLYRVNSLDVLSLHIYLVRSNSEEKVKRLAIFLRKVRI
jgi:hypothetical protein